MGFYLAGLDTALHGAVALLALIPAGIAWLLGGFAATMLYLGGTGIVLGLRERENRRAEA